MMRKSFTLSDPGQQIAVGWSLMRCRTSSRLSEGVGALDPEVHRFCKLLRMGTRVHRATESAKAATGVGVIDESGTLLRCTPARSGRVGSAGHAWLLVRCGPISMSRVSHVCGEAKYERSSQTDAELEGGVRLEVTYDLFCVGCIAQNQTCGREEFGHGGDDLATG
jgi:hypothetical protein